MGRGARRGWDVRDPAWCGARNIQVAAMTTSEISTMTVKHKGGDELRHRRGETRTTCLETQGQCSPQGNGSLLFSLLPGNDGLGRKGRGHPSQLCLAATPPLGLLAALCFKAG